MSLEIPCTYPEIRTIDSLLEQKLITCGHVILKIDAICQLAYGVDCEFVSDTELENLYKQLYELVEKGTVRPIGITGKLKPDDKPSKYFLKVDLSGHKPEEVQVASKY